VAVVVVLIRAFLMGTEPPIRVRNGSMHIILDKGEWTEIGDAWFPSEGENKGVVVTVESAKDTCPQGQTKSGKDISITYHNGVGDDVEFTFKPLGTFGTKTQVKPKDKLNKVSNSELSHGTKGDKGYISLIQVKSKGDKIPWACKFENPGQLDVIYICPASSPVCWKTP
jgi:hypothetical protein